MKHLSKREIAMAIEGSSSHEAHLASCDACRRRVEELRGLLAVVREVEVPEPSPLFWTGFSNRVREAVAAEPRSTLSGGWQRLIAWPVWAIGTVAVAVIALVSVGQQAPTPVLSLAMERAESDVAFEGDASWLFVADVAGELDWETAEQVGLAIRPGAAERALRELSETERRVVAELLQQELADLGSSSL